MGEIITIGSGDGTYNYELPNLPKESEILYYDLPKKEQFWRTPADLKRQLDIRDVKKMPEREKIEYINMWRERWHDGMWFMNNGEPTYITGMNLDHLVFNSFNIGTLYYLKSQKERFYFRDLTNKDRLCDGRVWVKARRTGITTEEMTEAIRCIISDFNNKVAMQSTKLEICQRTLMTPIIDAYSSRPKWMRENFYSNNGRKLKSVLSLTSNLIADDEDKWLGGFIMPFPTLGSAVDGDGWMLDIMDELSKWVTALPYETYEINKKAIVNPRKRGKMDLLSTTGDSKESANAVVDWHKIIANSNPVVRNKNGKTNTGLYKYFVSGIHSLDITEELPDVLDKYGEVNKEMAEEFLWNEINKHPKDSKQYIYALYKTPMEERHALLSPSNSSFFSKIRITKRLDELRNLANDLKPYIMGSLNDKNGKVYFESNEEQWQRCEKDGTKYEHGYWAIALHPYFSMERNIDTRNRFKIKNGVYFTSTNPEFGGGYDPVRYPKPDTTSTSLSKAAIIIYKKFDYFGSNECNQYAALYLHRPDNPRDAHKEAIKAAKYYGCKIMHERVIETVKEDFIDANCLPLLAQNEKDLQYGMWIDSQGKVVQNAVDWMVSRFSAPKEGESDQIDILPFEDCLTDMDNFDIAHTTRFDVFMAMIELEYCLKQMVFNNVSDTSGVDMQRVINELFPKFS